MNFYIYSIPLWFELVSLAFFFGTLVCRLWVLSPASSSVLPGLENRIRTVWLYFGVGIALMFASSIAELLAHAAEMSGKPLGSVFPLLPAVILKTHFGRVWLIRMASLLLISVVAGTAGRRRESRAFLYLLLGLGAIIAMTESASGHASDAGDFSITEIMDWLHLLAALVWGGGLFILSLIILPNTVKAGEHAAPVLAEVSRRFSRIAGTAVLIIALTAVYNARVYVGSVEALLESPYGRIIIAKIVLFLVLLGLAAFNRYVSVPCLQEWAGRAPGNRGIVSSLGRLVLTFFTRDLKGHMIAVRLARMVRIEAFLVTAVLLCVGLLKHEIPARHFAHLAHIQAAGGHMGAHDGHMHRAGTGTQTFARIETKPAAITAGTPVSLLVYLNDRKGRPLQGLTIHHERILHAVIIGRDLGVFAHIHPEDLGPVTDEMLKEAAFPLRFTFPKAGTYLIGLDFALPDGLYSKTASIVVSGQPAMAEPVMDLARVKTFGEYQATLVSSPKSITAGTETRLRFLIRKNGRPVRDLEPYLGAPMHLAIVRSDLTYFMHTHGEVPEGEHTPAAYTSAVSQEQFGPEIDSEIVFPAPGIFKVFGQVNHHGNVVLIDFMVKVELQQAGS
ncbi:MAG: copper resistance D family protein [Betaproteobacteria bacterium]